MSFSGDIKNELARRFPDEYHCLLAELAAIIHYAGSLSGNADCGSIVVETENVALAKKYLRLIRRAFDITLSLDIRKLPSGKRNLYRIELSSEEEQQEYADGKCGRKQLVTVRDSKDGNRSECIAAESAEKRFKEEKSAGCDPGRESAGAEENRFGDAAARDIIGTDFAGDRFSRVWRETADWEKPGFKECLLEYSCCRRAFIRGAFLTSGSMSDPGKSYHFEVVCRTRQGAEELCAVMESFDIHPKIVLRKSKPVVYLKDSEVIVDILNVMGASGALMRLENVRIIKDMKNSANRQSNCDSANINKIVRAAVRQVEDIRLIERKMGFSQLPPMLREMAQIRLEHPEESLQELGTYLNPPVGKSGVNHRLKKLSEIAETLR
ncbi:MAG: DNA-binding protein WhiA [Lachnospiraceae bacterium]|nr:DNA-binding protein WhiA [Lachnospiraceae bacterium]